MDLSALRDALTDEGLPAAFEPASAELEADRVNVALDTEGFAEPLILQVTQIEAEPEAISELEMIQLYIPIPIELDEEAIEDILAVLPDVNQVVPLIGFNLHLEERFVYFRHVMLIPSGEIGLRLVTEAIWMAHFALDTFAYRFATMAQRGNQE